MFRILKQNKKCFATILQLGRLYQTETYSLLPEEKPLISWERFRNRKLYGHMERAINYLSRSTNDAHHIVRTFRLSPEKEIDPSILRKALGKIQEINPMLQIVEQQLKRDDIRNILFSKTKQITPIPLKLTERRDENHWKEIVSSELNEPFRTEKSERKSHMRATLLSNGSGDCELILTIHHLISDGRSFTRLCENLLNQYLLLEKGIEEKSQCAEEILYMLSHEDIEGFRGVYNATKAIAAIALKELINRTKTFPIRENIPAFNRSTDSLFRLISSDISNKFITACHENRVTVGSAISAAMLYSAKSILTSLADSEKVNLSLTSTIDIRERFEPTIPLHILGPVFSVLRTSHTVAYKEEFWDLCKDIRRSQVWESEKNVPLHLLKIMPLAAYLDVKTNIKKHASVNISNLGRLELPKEVQQRFNVTEIISAVSCTMRCIFISACTSPNGGISLGCTFPKNMFDRKMVEEFIDNGIEYIRQIAEYGSIKDQATKD